MGITANLAQMCGITSTAHGGGAAGAAPPPASAPLPLPSSLGAGLHRWRPGRLPKGVGTTASGPEHPGGSVSAGVPPAPQATPPADAGAQLVARGFLCGNRVRRLCGHGQAVGVMPANPKREPCKAGVGDAPEETGDGAMNRTCQVVSFPARNARRSNTHGQDDGLTLIHHAMRRGSK